MGQQRNPWKGLVAGMAGGLVAAWAMNRFQAVWNIPFPGPSRSKHPWGENEAAKEQDDTTVKTASAISEKVFGHRLTEKEKRVAGTAVHYLFGTLVGGLYGGVAERFPKVTHGGGLPFGTVFWLTADETAVPLLGLSKPPTQYPMSVHLYAFLSHLVFGAVAETARKAVRDRL